MRGIFAISANDCRATANMRERPPTTSIKDGAQIMLKSNWTQARDDRKHAIALKLTGGYCPPPGRPSRAFASSFPLPEQTEPQLLGALCQVLQLPGSLVRAHLVYQVACAYQLGD